MNKRTSFYLGVLNGVSLNAKEPHSVKLYSHPINENSTFLTNQRNDIIGAGDIL